MPAAAATIRTGRCLARRSQNHQPTVTRTPHAAHASVRSDVQPQVWAWVIASRIADSPAAKARGAEPVDRPRCVARPRGHDEHHDRDHRDGERGGDPEDAVVVGTVVDQ